MTRKSTEELSRYWDEQHVKREEEFRAREKEPNEFAKKCLEHIRPGGQVLEIGIANGRDARYFARENQNRIVGVDISTEAVRQLIRAAMEDGTIDKILPVVASAQEVPELLGDQERYDAFYCRSALHLDDEETNRFLEYVVAHLNKDGVVMIEGKTNDDQAIQGSTDLGGNCYEDAGGHIRRVWTEDNIKKLCEILGLEIVEMGRTTEVWRSKETKFIHFVAKKK